MIALALVAGVLFMALSYGPLPIQPGQIIELPAHRTLQQEEFLDALEGHRVILVGESHDDPQHHAVQREIIRALHQRRGEVAVGMEMFHRGQQPDLDRWSAGELSEEEFLDRVEWYFNWGFDAELYLPILRTVRKLRLPLLALNVERELVQQVARQGLEGLTPEQRQRIPPLAPAPTPYRGSLGEVFDSHPAMARRGEFEHFVQAQQTWDGVMAAALREWLEAHPGGTVVGVMGRGHVSHGFGVALQLAHQGGPAATLVLPWSVDQWLDRDAAHYAWGTPTPPPTPHPVRLGIELDQKNHHVMVARVTEHSLAGMAGIHQGDRIVTLDAAPVTGRHQLVRLIRAKRWGEETTLGVERKGRALTFPIRLESPHRGHGTP